MVWVNTHEVSGAIKPTTHSSNNNNNSSSNNSSSTMENLTPTQNIEYSTLQREYAAFARSIDVVADRVRIVTFEDVEVEAQFSAAGWMVMALSSSTGRNAEQDNGAEQDNDAVQVDDIFETSEALLMRLSPRFTQLWNEKLFEKLSALQ